MTRLLFLAAALITLEIGCAAPVKQSGKEAFLPEIDVIQVKENSDEALQIAQEAKLDVEVLATKITNIDNKIIVLSEEVSSVSIAKIEELENRLALLIEAYKDLQAQVTALEAMPLRALSKKTAPPKDPSFSPASAANLLGSPDYMLYQNGLKVFNNRIYDKAITIFTDVIEQFPNGKYATMSQFWIGRSFYAQEDYASAIAAYNQVLKNTRSAKGDDAQFEISLSYLKMGQQRMASTEFQKLIDRYPASEYIDRAKKYLAEIK